MRKLLYLLTAVATLTACKKEIDFDYHEVAPIVTIEGRVTNEGMEVRITQSHNVNDSVKSPGMKGAYVVITDGEETFTLPYDVQSGYYKLGQTGTVGHTYRLLVELNGNRYEASSTMPPPVTLTSTEFLWAKIMDQRLLMYELWGDFTPMAERNYFWYRMVRNGELYRWGTFDDRGRPAGHIFSDITCMTEKMMEENKEEDREKILYDGDRIAFDLLTIDRGAYDYLHALKSGQGTGANPVSNISGGCLGFFTAASVTHVPPIILHLKEVREATRATGY